MSATAADAVQLERGAAALGASLDASSASLLLKFLDRLYAWNLSAGLTSVARSDAVRLHLLDSLSIVRFLPEKGSIVDLGTGGGLPGIPVAVALPNATVTLIEARRKKVSFLAETVRELGLRNCRVERADAHHLAARGQLYDAVMARAFLAPIELVEAGSALILVGGRIVIMGARRGMDFDAPADRDLTQTVDERIVLPGGSERRRIIVLERIGTGAQSR